MKTETKNYVMYIIILILVNFAIYSVSINYKIFNGWDDQRYVLRNTHFLVLSWKNISHWFIHPCVGCYLPVTMFSYMFDYNLFELNSFFYHLQNICWHILAVLAIYNIFIKLKINLTIAFLVCLLFSIHPQRVESVVWISERKDVLCSALYFWSIYFYIEEKNKISIILFILSILAKPMAISLPFVLLLYDVYIKEKVTFNQEFRKLWKFFIVSIIFLPVTYFMQGTAIVKTISLSYRIIITIYNIFWYIKQTFIPQNLNPIYPIISKSVLLSFNTYLFLILISGFVILSCIYYRKIFILISLGYIITLAPVSGFIPLGTIDHADRYSYIPTVFLCLGLAFVLTKLNELNFFIKKIIITLLLTFALVFSVLNIMYQFYWKSYELIIDYACSFPSVNPIALVYQGEYAIQTHQYLKAINVGSLILESKGNKRYNSNYFKIRGCFIKGISYTRLGEYNSSVKDFNQIYRYCGNEINFSSKMHYFSLLDAMAESYYKVGNNKKALNCINALLTHKKLSKKRLVFYEEIRKQILRDYVQK